MWTLCQVLLQGQRMNFRQRMAWLFLLGFLLASIGLVYYIFELSDQYNVLALEHSQNYEEIIQKSPDKVTFMESIWGHVVSMPFWAWMLVLLVPYLQVFCLLLACTKSNPIKSSLIMIPLFVCLRLKTGKTQKANNCLNGNDMFHT